MPPLPRYTERVVPMELSSSKPKVVSSIAKMGLTLNHRTTIETPARDYKYLNADQYLPLARTTVKNTFDGLDKNNLLNNGGFSAGTRVYRTKVSTATTSTSPRSMII